MSIEEVGALEDIPPRHARCHSLNGVEAFTLVCLHARVAVCGVRKPPSFVYPIHPHANTRLSIADIGGMFRRCVVP